MIFADDSTNYPEHAVEVWQETVILPTYEVGHPEKNPIFLEKRVYQGSSGVVYPHAVIEKISDEKTDKEYTALFLENIYLKIMILPQLGGRVHRAYDKIRKRDFVYHNHVIKPALVGLTGPWISGGIEFNWPQHHRPSTFMPVDFTLKDNEDGSKTVWVNEVELMNRTKCQAGFTLYPDKAYLEVKAKLYNRTSLPQTFLWWANPALKVNEHFQSVFPPDVHAVFDHGKRDVSEFPIAKGKYYNVDYSPGTDISRYVNIPVPTSYMAIQSKYDFIGGYEHDGKAGMLHVADHHISPGKKQWTWGSGDFGKAWDRNLTDEDGPYVELMTGVYTDNQPDFSWLQPNEEKTFEQYFMPYCKLGLVKNATKEAMINVEVTGQVVTIKVYTTAEYPGSLIQCSTISGFSKTFKSDLTPLDAFEISFECPDTVVAESLVVIVLNSDGKRLVNFEQESVNHVEIPTAASPAKRPADITTNEELFLNGLHLEQYRHATWDATDFYQEALKRDPADIRCNNAMGLWLMRHGQLNNAITYFNRSISTAVKRNPNPYDGEPYYNRGICLGLLGKYDEAYDSLYKATWNDALQHSSYLELAKIDLAKGRLNEALAHLEKSLVKNYHSHAARFLQAIVLRKMGNYYDALFCIEDSLQIDPFGYGLLYEGYLCCLAIFKDEQAESYLSTLQDLARGSVNNFIEYSIEYGNSGCFDEAVELLEKYIGLPGDPYPMTFYFLSYYSFQKGDLGLSAEYLHFARQCKSDYCFPNKLEELIALQFAVSQNPNDAKAHYYLGNWWYGKRQHDEALEAFEKAIALDPEMPTPHRNLALLYFNKRNEKKRACSLLEKAFALDQSDARVLMELDQLYCKLNMLPAERLSLLELHLPLIEQRDDLYLERICLLNCLGANKYANELLLNRIFHPWEGGEGKVVGQYLFCQLMMAMNSIIANEYEKASSFLENTTQYPESLGEGKLYGRPENDINYMKGLVLQLQDKHEEATLYFRRATQYTGEPKLTLFYNDPQPDNILYQGLAYQELNETIKAKDIFKSLIEYGEKHMNDDVQIDYFAVSLPDVLVFEKDLQKSNRVHCQYLIGLGELGMENVDKALDLFKEVQRSDTSHLGVLRHLKLIEVLHHIKIKQQP